MSVAVATPAIEGGRPSGLLTWLTTTDHKRIGQMYLTAAFGFFLFGGLLALLIRSELAVPGLHAPVRGRGELHPNGQRKELPDRNRNQLGIAAAGQQCTHLVADRPPVDA